jgi:uncharacterized protein YpmS
MKKDLEKMKKKKFKTYFLFVIPIALVLIVIGLLFHKPNDYAPLKIADQNQISTYLTHYLMPTVYNNSQLDAPFDVVITEEGLNDIIARWRQPMQFDGITFTRPQAILTQKRIIFMAAAQTKFASTVLTVRLIPKIDSSGKLYIRVENVSLGEAPITSLAKSIGKKTFVNWMSFTGTDPNDTVAQICCSLLNDESFVPVFKVADKSLRVCKIKMENKKIIAALLPIPQEPLTSQK